MDATTEFEEKTAEPDGGDGVTGKVETPSGVSREEFEAVKNALAEKAAELADLGPTKDVISRLQAVFGGKSESKLSDRDQYIKKEMLRIMPELGEVGADVKNIGKILPTLVMALEATVEERVQEKADSAQEHLRSVMKGAGLNHNDDEAAGYLEEAVTREIRSNKELLGLWTRGNVKSAVDKAFAKVQSKLLAPARAGAKRSAVETITGGVKPTPRPGSASTGAGEGAAKPKVDLTDASRENVRKIHDGAFDYLQELLDK
jgi:hypothetical protein